MRKFPLITTMFVGLALSISIAACDGGDDGSEMAADTSSGDGDGDPGDGDPGDGDGDPTGGECFPQPPICEQFVRCIAAVVPGQAELVEAQYGAEGSCWCGTSEEAQKCYETCGAEVEKAKLSSPTESQCHDEVCPIEELNPDEPYGPIEGGNCSDYIGPQGNPIAQTPFDGPLGISGGFCSPACSGLADYCPGHKQTSAQGTCYLVGPNDNFCVARCYVNSEFLGGHQCQCGAKCQPQGSPDGEGQMRGLCTFE
ncbi:hypothetical protein [Enhygromyxa salina]|uniref:Uncharacterized protein n=1 Tax=Enhygromyxa salina TaxID=215803 RepID=A0A2S9XZ22_9BACT|nr:hypothetical protein [Enhygromyxa salina]PRP98112.1 hypothetical protein ENSA7_66090 [Enhygromyxa salina]